ncbi:1,2-phenylacetyl-CoA epoxidase subunit PaaD [Sphaerisporangium corydalis]|uniref:1,2-phenylacetyl-CoA epoxidase subunit PaaD n=1 Tax=Sphaerisporangium corydalis TaxID=1441875 RepID=A0ABV9ECI2_9ACTN|nr:1,2-phenylacetyl-CoA epoxidase subunit PaaD [Sphaerisporangium corydalis]
MVTARGVAGAVADPELPMLTLADLGILREVEEKDGGAVVVTITPTYSGCPAMGTIRADLFAALREAGYADVQVRTLLFPAWTTDWITRDGRRKLAEAGIAPPGTAPVRHGPVPLTLGPAHRRLDCPNCGSGDTEELSRFGATACKSLWRCRACREPFEHLKEL